MTEEIRRVDDVPAAEQSRVEYMSPDEERRGALETTAAVVGIVAAAPTAVANVAKAAGKVGELLSKAQPAEVDAAPDDGGFLPDE